ncbi:MAG: AraC family transcriptional regulator ligand-binding domain-containing protein [Panacagrimonas sp.]
MPSSHRPAEPAHGVVPGSYVRLLYEYLEARGVDAVKLLGEAAPNPQGSGPGRYPVERWRRHLEKSATHLHDSDLGLHLGQTVTPRHFGVMGYVLLACGTLGAALTRLHHYQRLVYDVSPMRLRAQAQSVTLEWGTEHGRPGRLVDETAITALVQFARDVTGEHAKIESVHFVNEPPADLAPYRRYFGGEVLFEQDRTRVRLPLPLLAKPLRQPDAALLALLEHQAEALLADLPDAGDLEQAVRRAVAANAREGEISLERVAAALHTSPRTLHRRLDQLGLGFRELRDDTRRRLAEQHLSDAGLSIAEVALLLGYSEQSAFTRAFGRWTHTTPARWRRQAAS